MFLLVGIHIKLLTEQLDPSHRSDGRSMYKNVGSYVDVGTLRFVKIVKLPRSILEHWKMDTYITASE